MKKTTIYSGGKGLSADQLLTQTPGYVDFVFPELRRVNGGILPRTEEEQVWRLPELLGTTIITLSEIIILIFLREIRKGRMRTDQLDLYCDGRKIDVGLTGDMIDPWDGGFFETGFNLRFN